MSFRSKTCVNSGVLSFHAFLRFGINDELERGGRQVRLFRSSARHTSEFWPSPRSSVSVQPSRPSGLSPRRKPRNPRRQEYREFFRFEEREFVGCGFAGGVGRPAENLPHAGRQRVEVIGQFRFGNRVCGGEFGDQLSDAAVRTLRVRLPRSLPARSAGRGREVSCARNQT